LPSTLEAEAMQLIRKIRFSMGTIMMFVLMAAAAMALFVKIQHLIDGTPIPPGWNFDVPSLFLLAIALTAVALASWKEHSAVQTMLQVTLACVGCLSLIWIGEAKYERAIRYWCQGTFAATVTLPMLARRFVRSGMPRGPRRDWWKKTCEAVFFSFLTMMLVSAGGLLQWAVYMMASSLPLVQVVPAPTPVTPPATTVPATPDPALAPDLPPVPLDPPPPQSPREPSPGPG
jgi:hypothetical protein